MLTSSMLHALVACGLFAQKGSLLYSSATLLFIGDLSEHAVLLILFLVVLPFVLWVWAVVDVLRSTFTDNTAKLVWLLVIIFIPVLGVLLYFIMGKNQKVKQNNYPTN